MKVLILAPFYDERSTVHGLTAGFDACGVEWAAQETNRSPVPTKTQGFADLVVRGAESFDTVLIGKGTVIPMPIYTSMVSRLPDTTYLTFDSVSGNGCGPVGRPDDLGPRGLLCDRILCTGSEGARWFRRNGFEGGIAQIYQGCRHSIWRPESFDKSWGSKHQISFIGSSNYNGDGGRRAKLKALAGAGFKIYTPKRIYHQEASSIYYDSAICLNMVCGTPGEGVTPVGITSNRLVRTLTSGGFSLTERNTDIAATFEEGNQLATFDFGNPEHLIERARYYLDNQKERYDIARRGWEWSQDWGWDKQAEKIMRFIDGDDVPADGAASPWVGSGMTDDDKNTDN